MAAPLAAGATHETLAEVLPRTAVGAAGVDGMVAGVSAAEAADAAETPTELVAVTANV